MRRYLVLGSAVAAPLAFLFALIGVGSPASADPYTPTLPASCRVAVPIALVGDRVVVRVRVTAAGNLQPTGTVSVGVDRTFSTTVRYDGTSAEVHGPRLSRGEHRVRVSFVPDDPTKFSGCRDAVTVNLGVERADAVGGALPDTGGPHLGLLLAGIGLVAGGGGLVGRGRRRT
ncbi:LPXTG cell wall anchor domain-containing protein [Nocardioides daeguensis]|uniref:Gram-positive cocci surface proteins LPxTG domain-containing protein n=1 Tax=Nocardioides daeguensis TaxID=908359 RepID=A0ABP6WFW1_9ACTN|nr:LPXTG cell wall anchor domain-containing protein [Nocardioides daeguensis]MBV6729592.1 LPXTG cell wall anchor domain-containing protein [Nocardioides daeguensis]MCR1775024.1 LPXTG cell wall anchor domain-containing protein [Nocardioides daeguensis]